VLLILESLKADHYSINIFLVKEYKFSVLLVVLCSPAWSNFDVLKEREWSIKSFKKLGISKTFKGLESINSFDPSLN